ncbi:hypothetical protein Bwad005_05080 [Bilophila wadsworthia]|uniref:hypothetical protein n=1 Tax=Bilophila wadsworthia TaxID=35833 RepID=UPI0026DAE480|nr:hypothetical protein [Bilophila wadsworthia]
MEKSILVQKIEDMIGPGRQFSSTNELAQYLGLGSTKHTKFYDFLEGANTGYKAVLEWLDKLQVQVVFPGQPLVEHSATKVQSQEVDLLKKRLDELQKENDQLKLQNAELRGANDVLRSVLKIDQYADAPEKKRA